MDHEQRDPRDFTARALHASATWQVICEQQMNVRQLAREAVFHGDHPIGEVTRFLAELQRNELQETYARMMHQSALDWMVSGRNHDAHYHEHATQLWGSELAGRFQDWWKKAFEPRYAAIAAAVAQDTERSTG
jgi:hypothetical protein